MMLLIGFLSIEETEPIVSAGEKNFDLKIPLVLYIYINAILKHMIVIMFFGSP